MENPSKPFTLFFRSRRHARAPSLRLPPAMAAFAPSTKRPLPDERKIRPLSGSDSVSGRTLLALIGLLVGGLVSPPNLIPLNPTPLNPNGMPLKPSTFTSNPQPSISSPKLQTLRTPKP